MHGVKVLLSFIAKNNPSFKAGQTVIEIGSTRDIGSTFYLAEYCQKHNLNLITIDPSDESHAEALKVFEKFDYKNLTAVKAKGEDYLATYSKKDICMAYIDGFDIVTAHPHLPSTIKAYTDAGIDLLKDGNRISAEVHLEATKYIAENAVKDALLCFDDTWKEDGQWMGKGATAVPFLFTKGGETVTPPSKRFWQKRKYNHGVIVKM
jgi:hypothetical protein